MADFLRESCRASIFGKMGRLPVACIENGKMPVFPDCSGVLIQETVKHFRARCTCIGNHECSPLSDLRETPAK